MKNPRNDETVRQLREDWNECREVIGLMRDAADEIERLNKECDSYASDVILLRRKLGLSAFEDILA